MTTRGARLHATEVFQQFPQPEAAAMVNSVYVDVSLYFNIVGPEPQRFYLDTGTSACGPRDMVERLIRREFRTAMVCGNFQQSLGYIEGIITQLREPGTEVLSPAAPGSSRKPQEPTSSTSTTRTS